MKFCFSYVKKHMGIFLASMMFLTMEAVADLLQPTFMSYIVDDGIANADVKRVIHFGLIMLLIAGVGAFSAVMRNWMASVTAQKIAKEMRHDLYAKIQTLSFENIDRLQPASLITRITNDVTQVQEFVNSMMRIMVKAPITCVGAIVLIIVQTPKQAPIMAIILVIVSILIFCNIRIGYPKFGIVQQKLDKLNGSSREFISSVRVVKAFRAEDEETEKFEGSSEELAAANVSAQRVMAVFTPLINLTVNFGIVILLWISKDQDASYIGRLMASVNYMTQVLFAVTMIANIINTAVRAVASSERIVEVLSEENAQKQEEHPLTPDIKGDVEFDHVSFTYAGSTVSTLKDISFKIPAGQTLGIIGPTGSGKSTVINLVPRFYDAQNGKVMVDGCDVTKIDEKLLRNAVAVVPQKALLFTGTIMDNLRWGNPLATDEELFEAARIACAESFILESENGYQTLLGQGGVNLSGGQKQRLSLARALVRKPKILILDDCTSALDAQTEYTVLEGLAKSADDMTVLLISQRISTVMRADLIMCLDDGQVKGLGTHEQLLSDCRVYQQIYKSQIGGGIDG